MPIVDLARSIDRFRKLIAEHANIRAVYKPGERTANGFRMGHEAIDRAAVAEWAVKAQRALEQTFPASDSVHRQWAALGYADGWSLRTIPQAGGVIRAALAEIESGHLDSVIASAIAENEIALIAQARDACDQGDKWAAAGAVLAGGAIELRLRRLVAKIGASVKGHGSIEKYMLAIENARETDPAAVYPMTDDGSIERWRQMRNAAAHDPATFTTAAGFSAMKVAGELGLIEEWLRRTATLT